MIPDLYGYIGAVFVAMIAVPQLLKTMTDRRADGVSVSSWAMQGTGALTFLLYGCRIGSPPQIVGNILPAAGAAAIVILILKTRRVMSAAKAVAATAALATYLAILALALEPLVVGGVAVAMALICRWPQVMASLKSLRNHSASEVSKLTWAITILAMSFWMVYAVIAVDVPVILANIVGISASAIVLVSEMLNDRRRADEISTPATSVAASAPAGRS